MLFPSTPLSAPLFFFFFFQRRNKHPLGASFSQSESDGKHPAENIRTFGGWSPPQIPAFMLEVLLAVAGFISVYLLETKFAGFFRSRRVLCFRSGHRGRRWQISCLLRVVSANAVEERSHQLAPLHTLIFLIEHIFPHLFESPSQRAESFVRAADFWDVLINPGPYWSKRGI